MTTPVLSASPLGQRTTYKFEPPYTSIDFAHMAALIDDATLCGLASIRLIHDAQVTVTTIGAKE